MPRPEINTFRHLAEDHHEIPRIRPAQPGSPEWLSTATLYVPGSEEWHRLDALRRSYTGTSIVGRREVSAGGWSVSVQCQSPDEAAKMVGDWCFGQAGRSVRFPGADR